jgi:hypothetical protein
MRRLTLYALTEKKMRASIFLMALFLTPAAAAFAGVAPCDFKGIAVGDKMTPTDLMAKLGIAVFQNNPPIDPTDWATQREKLKREYGQQAADEILNDRKGNICQSGFIDFCSIPNEITIGEGDIPVSLFIDLKNSVITEIIVTFNAKYWNQIVSLIVSKFGPSWDIRKENIYIVDEITNKHATLSRTYMIGKSDGENVRTGDRCSLGAISIRSTYRHHNNLGEIQGNFEIKLK